MDRLGEDPWVGCNMASKLPTNMIQSLRETSIVVFFPKQLTLSVRIYGAKASF